MLTKLDIFIGELVEAKESSVEDLGRALESLEGDVEKILGAEHYKVPHLAAVGPDLVPQPVRTVVDGHTVKWAAGGRDNLDERKVNRKGETI